MVTLFPYAYRIEVKPNPAAGCGDDPVTPTAMIAFDIIPKCLMKEFTVKGIEFLTFSKEGKGEPVNRIIDLIYLL